MTERTRPQHVARERGNSAERVDSPQLQRYESGDCSSKHGTSSNVTIFNKAIDLEKRHYVVYATLPDGRFRQLHGEAGMRVRDLIANVVLEFKLSEYRVKLSDTLALLNVDADASVLASQKITIEDTTKDYLQNLPDDTDARLKIIYDFVETEKNYMECLCGLKPTYSEPLRKCSLLSQEEVHIMFSWLEPFLSMNSFFFSQLQEVLRDWNNVHTSLGKLFTEEFLSMYSNYHLRYPHIKGLLNEKKNSDIDFKEFCQKQRGAARHSIDSLLLLPVQRIPQYDQYLTSLLEKTPKSHPTYEDLHPVVQKVNNMVKERENEIQVAGNQYKLEQVQERFPHDNLQLFDKAAGIAQKSKNSTLKRRSKGTSLSKSKVTSSSDKTNHNDSSRLYVMEGPVQLTTGVQTQDRYIFLFNDVLLIAKTKSGTTFRLKQKVRVSEMWTACCLEEVCESSKSMDKSFVLGWPTSNYVVTFPSSDLRQLWCNMINKNIKEERMKEEPKILNLKVSNNDVNGYSVTRSIPVCNSDDANEVIRLCLEQFKINDYQTNDFQLWVQSRKEDTLYPLIGHEIPFAIQINHLRDMYQNDEGVLDLDSSMDNYPSGSQCQFVLRLKRKSNRMNLDVSGAHKPFKKAKRSSLINFKFKRSTSKSGDSVDGSTSSPRLFGLPLQQLFVDGNLPIIISDLLNHVYNNAPFLTGVFRKSANARVCRELKEKLESGEEVNFDDYPVLVTATILKDLIRSLPDCLFICNLYDSWLECIEIENGTERIHRTKTMFDKLPEINQSLLRQFFCILYHIDKNSEENNMNAYNLSVCVGQSLIFPPTKRTNNNPAETSKKIPLLIEFMLENLTTIMGSDVTSIFGSPPVKGSKLRSRHDSGSGWDSDSTSDHTGHLRRDDESLDSLDREINFNENNVQYIYSNQLSPSALSKDSEIHLSDSQLFTESDTTDTTDSGYDSKALSPNCLTSRIGLSHSLNRNITSPESILRTQQNRERRQSEPMVSPPPTRFFNKNTQDKLFYQREPKSDSRVSTSKKQPNLSEMRRKNILEFDPDLLGESPILSPRFANDLIEGLRQPSQVVDSHALGRMNSAPVSPTVQFTKFQIIGVPPHSSRTMRRSNSISSILDVDLEIENHNKRRILSPQTGRKFTSPRGLFYVEDDSSLTCKRAPPTYHAAQRKVSLKRSDAQRWRSQPKVKRDFSQETPRAQASTIQRSPASEKTMVSPRERRLSPNDSPEMKHKFSKRIVTPSRLKHKLNVTCENEDSLQSPPTEFFPSQATTSTLPLPMDSHAMTRSSVRRSISDPHDKPRNFAPPSYQEAMNRRAVLQHRTHANQSPEQGLTIQNVKTIHSHRTTLRDSRRKPITLNRTLHEQFSESDPVSRYNGPHNRYMGRSESNRVKSVQRSSSDNYDKRMNSSPFYMQEHLSDSYRQPVYTHRTASPLSEHLSSTAKNASPISSDDEELSQSHSEESYV
ncbi:uncharacterized protein LOC144433321 [Glandiceps talaboti]